MAKSAVAAAKTAILRTGPAWLAVSAASLFSLSAVAQDADGLSFTPDLLSVEMKEDDQDALEEARFKSGLGVKLNSGIVQFAVDYNVESQLKESADKAAVSQQVGASLYSSALNDLLGMNADIKAGSTFKSGGDAYEYSITPGLSKSLAELGDFSVKYIYLLDKDGAQSLEKEKLGYSMGLNGETSDGRLSWKGNYHATDVYGGVDQLQSTELLEFESAYQLAPELQLQVSGRSKDETLFDGGIENDFYTETRYGAGFAWSPSRYYSVAFKVNKLDESRTQNDEVFGSGTVSWFPQRNMKFTLSYGDHLVEGARGLMFSTRIDLNDS